MRFVEKKFRLIFVYIGLADSPTLLTYFAAIQVDDQSGQFFNEVFIIYTLIPVFIQTRRILTGLALLNQVLEVETNPELLDESLRSGRLRLAPLLPLLQQVKF